MTDTIDQETRPTTLAETLAYADEALTAYQQHFLEADGYADELATALTLSTAALRRATGLQPGLEATRAILEDEVRVTTAANNEEVTLYRWWRGRALDVCNALVKLGIIEPHASRR